MDKNTVLVVMPIYNAEKTLGAAIESILNQSYRQFKLVLVDDASTDNSLEIAKSYTYDNRVVVYHNSENRGAYYSRNLGLYMFQNKPWGFFTTHDADDISFVNRFENLINVAKARGVNGVQDIFERIDYKTGRTKGRHLTIAHALFTRAVFEKLGYFDLVRFGADWDYWARLTVFNKTNKTTTKSFNRVVGKSYILDNNLTVQIPIRSLERKQYISDRQAMHEKMLKSNSFYIDFSPEGGIGRRVVHKAKSKPPQQLGEEYQGEYKSLRNDFVIDPNLRVAVVLLTWQRIANLRNTLNLLEKQTYKNFDIHISNANLTERAITTIEKYINVYRARNMNISVTHDGNDTFAFRRFTAGKKLKEQGYDVVLFIDDDISFPSRYIQRCLEQYEPKSYKSGFAWSFYNKGSSYYKYRTRYWDNNQPIHYCGTGISMVDASVFLEKGLIENVPEAAYKIEDLWLSYYVQHVLKWKLEYMETPGVIIGGADNVALFRQIQKDSINKDHFLRELVQMGWDIPK
jgi:glycosyltransferase involved in cell wall biosynthesis